MGKKLAIRGHATRGKKVIELLEMMGGKNVFACNGHVIKYGYYVSDHTIVYDSLSNEDDDFEIFTLEEFLEKYPFKVGDKVMDGHGNSLTIKSMSWSTDCETMVYDFEETGDVLCAEDLKFTNAEFLVDKEKSGEAHEMLTGFILDDLHRNHLKIVLDELYEHIKITPKEELEREFEEIHKEWSNVGPTVEEFMDFCNKVNKKPKYPTTYDECCEIMCVGLWNTLWGEDATEYERQTENLINALIRLKICRDAYWKIAGEEMRLGKPWEPDWNDGIQKYCIRIDRNKIVNCSSSFNNRILAFPTAEMRDAFYENFKDLIEQCKELL